jgi:SSS family solute:Na+ symporter
MHAAFNRSAYLFNRYKTLTIHPLDAAIVITYLAAILALGAWLGRGQKDTLEYLLGNRSLPTWALLLSIVATETSAVTFLSIPGATYIANGNMGFLQIAFGYIIGRFLVIGVLLPKYFEGQPFTAYEVLQKRFGIASRRVTSALFLVTRNIGDALRLYLTALALQQAIGLELTGCIVVMGVVTILYTLLGGVKSVVWNDCLQFFIYIFGAIVALGVIVYRLPGGWEQIWQFGKETERFRVFDFDLGWTKPSITFWSGIVGGMFLTAATHGTDQMMVLRYLSARSQRSAGWALGLSGFIVCAQFALFLVIGIGLACFYQQFPPDTPFGPQDGDKVFAHFIVNHLGRGLVGLTLAAIFAATLSSSLNSSAASLIYDIYLPIARHEPSAERKMWLSRVGTVMFGVIQIVVALASYQLGANESTVESVLKIAGFALGPMLGLYFLAVLAKRVQQRAALIGFVIGVAGISYIAFETSLSWPWYAAVGSTITFLTGLVASLLPQQNEFQKA